MYYQARAHRVHASLALAGACALAVAAEPCTAQAHVSTAVDSLRHIQEMSPTHGPVGTRVEISTLNLPVQAKVHVGYGATRTGFEALMEVPQGMWGDIAADLTVPPDAPWDRAIVFVAFNAIFSPIGLSDPFHVINEDGLIRRTGRITAEGNGCRTLRDQDGYLYALAGDLGDAEVGDEVVVDGTYAPTGSCLDGSTIGVVSIGPVGG
jgi:hypothetical protein